MASRRTKLGTKSDAIALFVPCYVDQLHPNVAIAALRVLERLGVEVQIPNAAICCGQPMANAGFARRGDRVLRQALDEFGRYAKVVVLSGSCAVHLRDHASEPGNATANGSDRIVEFTSYLHDVIGVRKVAELGATYPHRVAAHIGCHGLRALGLARSSEIQGPAFNKLRAILNTVQGVTVAELQRPDECCGFGGTFSIAEPDVSAKMGRDRLRDFQQGLAEAVVSTDVSCLMHLRGLASRNGQTLPMLHLAEVLAMRSGHADDRR